MIAWIHFFRGVYIRVGNILRSKLLLVAIFNFSVFVWSELRVCWFDMSVFQQTFFNIPFHGQASLALRVICSGYPFKVNS